MVDRLARALGYIGQGHIARGDHLVEDIARHAQALELVENRRAGTGRIGDQDHGATARPEALQGVAGGAIARLPIVDDAPDVAEDDIVAIGEFGEPEGDARLR